MIAPVLEELAGDYDGKADILKLDVDENPSTAEFSNEYPNFNRI